MKKILLFVLSCLLLINLCGCDEKNGQPTNQDDDNAQIDASFEVTKSEFYYSSDNGHTYGNRTKKFELGKSVYMQIQVKVDSHKPAVEGKVRTVKGEVVIPKVKNLDAYYRDGQKITPEVDSLNDTVTYPFTIACDKVWIFFFEFVPTSKSIVSVELNFDDTVDTIYDSMNTIEFVEKLDSNIPSETEKPTPSESTK